MILPNNFCKRTKVFFFVHNFCIIFFYIHNIKEDKLKGDELCHENRLGFDRCNDVRDSEALVS